MIYVRNTYTVKELSLKFATLRRERADLFRSLGGYIHFLDVHGEPGESRAWTVLS